MEKIELLAPARNITCGKAAIDSGADAVYIGGPSFGARVNAGNSLEDIKELCSYAHDFGAKIHVTLNTILNDEELKQARDLTFKLYDVGVDALIMQDLGLIMGELPPLELHASTQQNNSTVEKALFLEMTGFSQIVLARELSLEQIKNIKSALTTARLEFFVHGALCVSVSGRCYISECVTGRSANRGACAQLCRVPMSLKTSSGEYLAKDKYLLSLKDLNNTPNLEALMDAGVRSFKIEGRLKDEGFVRNVTAWYRSRLDEIFEKRSNDYRRSSYGTTETSFTPDVSKSFNRGFTDYKLYEKRENFANFDSPKYVGTEAAQVTSINGKIINVKPLKGSAFHNGDKFSYFSGGDINGFRISVAQGNNLEVFQNLPDLKPGMKLYRNKDAEFERAVAATNASIRYLKLNLDFKETEEGFVISAEDETGAKASCTYINKGLEKAKNPEGQRKNIETKLKKIGDTIYRINKLTLQTDFKWFIPVSDLNEVRHNVLEKLTEQKRKKRTIRKEIINLNIPLPSNEQNLGYEANIYNSKTQEFYKNHGAINITPAYEIQKPDHAVLMYCKQCMRYCFGMCEKYNNKRKVEPLELTIGNKDFKLLFDCKNCMMMVCNKTPK